MTDSKLFPNAPDITADDYCVFGLATCFVRGEDEVLEVQVIEPVPSAALEAILQGIPTSYQLVCARPLGEVVGTEALQVPAEFPKNARFAADFAERAIAAARTFKRYPQAQSRLPLGTSSDRLNYSLERKRILNADRVVTADDNVKQHDYTHQVL